MQQTVHRPAVGMAANDDVFDTKSSHRKFDGRCFTTVPRTVPWNDVPGIAKNK